MVLAISPRRPAFTDLSWPVRSRSWTSSLEVPSSSAASSGLYASRRQKARSRSRGRRTQLRRALSHPYRRDVHPRRGRRRVRAVCQVTISVGVAALDGAGCELTGMLAAADTALYRGDGP